MEAERNEGKVTKADEQEAPTEPQLSEEEIEVAPAESEVVRHHIIQTRICFDFALPKDVPKENGEAYARERLNHLIEKLGGLRGVKISCLLE